MCVHISGSGGQNYLWKNRIQDETTNIHVWPLNHHYSPIIVNRVEHTQSHEPNKQPEAPSSTYEIIDNQFHASTATNFHISLPMSLILRDNFFLLSLLFRHRDVNKALQNMLVFCFHVGWVKNPSFKTHKIVNQTVFSHFLFPNVHHTFRNSSVLVFLSMGTEGFHITWETYDAV